MKRLGVLNLLAALAAAVSLCALVFCSCGGRETYRLPDPVKLERPAPASATISFAPSAGVLPEEYRYVISAIGSLKADGTIYPPNHSPYIYGYYRFELQSGVLNTWDDVQISYLDYDRVLEHVHLERTRDGVIVDVVLLTPNSKCLLTTKDVPLRSMLKVSVEDSDGNPSPSTTVLIGTNPMSTSKVFSEQLQMVNTEFKYALLWKNQKPISGVWYKYYAEVWDWKAYRTGEDGTITIDNELPVSKIILGIDNGFVCSVLEYPRFNNVELLWEAPVNNDLGELTIQKKPIELCDVDFYFLDESGKPLPTSSAIAFFDGERGNPYLSIEPLESILSYHPNPTWIYTERGAIEITNQSRERKWTKIEGLSYTLPSGSYSPGIIKKSIEFIPEIMTKAGVTPVLDDATSAFGTDDWSCNVQSQEDIMMYMDKDGRLIFKLTLPAGKHKIRAVFTEVRGTKKDPRWWQYEAYGIVDLMPGRADIRFKMPSEEYSPYGWI